MRDLSSESFVRRPPPARAAPPPRTLSRDTSAKRESFTALIQRRNSAYMILVALVKGFQNHLGFAVLRASGED
eukprot:3223912-Prymnesium_polylepis.1